MEELTIVLLGKQGAGKSASGNTLLGTHPFHTAPSSERVTRACSMSMSTVDKQKIAVIDTPGWCDSSQIETEMKQHIIDFVIAYKPHVFLLLLPIGRFTEEEINTVMNILKEFGVEVTKYMIVLFTKGDALEERPIEDYLKELQPNLKSIIKICGERYHVFNNRNKEDRQQVSLLLEKMNEMVKKNEEKCYTEAMYNKNKTQQRNEGENSALKNRNQVSSCDTDRQEKGEKEEEEEEEKGKGETLDEITDLEKLNRKIDKAIKTIQKTETKFLQEINQQKEGLQQLQREFETIQRKHAITKNKLHPMDHNEQSQ